MKIKLILSIIAALSLSGCARWSNEVASDGGIMGSYEGDYVIRNDSGGRIVDMWVLRNVFVQHDGAGWMFRDKEGNVIKLGGDVKVMRVKDPELLSKYHTYHVEFETKTYQELYPVNNK